MEIPTPLENQSAEIVNFESSDARTLLPDQCSKTASSKSSQSRTPLPDRANKITTSKSTEARNPLEIQSAKMRNFKSSEVRTFLPDQCNKSTTSKSTEPKSEATTKPRKKSTLKKGAKVEFDLPTIEPLEKTLPFFENGGVMKQEEEVEVQPPLKKGKDEISTSRKCKAKLTSTGSNLLALLDNPEDLESSARIEEGVQVVEEPEYLFVGHMEVEAVKKLEEIMISADDLPQTNWNPYKCRKWIAAYLVANIAFKPHDATTLAAAYRGSGADLYALDKHEWEQIFGKWGFALYMGFQGFQNQRRALPEEMCKDEMD